MRRARPGHRNLTHPSRPNYIALTSGQTHFAGSDCPPTRCPHRRRLDLLPTRRHQLESVAESMPRNCHHTPNAGAYAPRHTAAPYYTRIAAACKKRDVPLGSTHHRALATDLARGGLPRYALIPNLRHAPTTDGSIARGDAWLAQWVPRLLATRGYTKGMGPPSSSPTTKAAHAFTPSSPPKASPPAPPSGRPPITMACYAPCNPCSTSAASPAPAPPTNLRRPIGL